MSDGAVLERSCLSTLDEELFRFEFNDSFQVFGPRSVTNIGEVLGPAVRVEVKGSLKEADSSTLRAPKRFVADINAGALCAGSGCLPLPIGTTSRLSTGVL